ncbi:hypothetical protein SGM_5067 [Streptomyces griseoaurantiacus M045]|uniref:Uncharacterized protein n=1 Tax=Streptomyces griseoaurantiacus M045 TaxID=996637 RepID=F3NPZ2_9ACTN|nr:hypothetical protein SGM_5067 [Streptomyces griseoaurantiacus M045]
MFPSSCRVVPGSARVVPCGVFRSGRAVTARPGSVRRGCAVAAGERGGTEGAVPGEADPAGGRRDPVLGPVHDVVHEGVRADVLGRTEAASRPGPEGASGRRRTGARGAAARTTVATSERGGWRMSDSLQLGRVRDGRVD